MKVELEISENVGFNYVDITSRACNGWINLFYRDSCIALIANPILATLMKEEIPKRVTYEEAAKLKKEATL